MDRNRADEQDATQPSSPDEAWREVGTQFEALGESLSRAFRAAWQSEDTRRQVRSVQDGLERMVAKVDTAVREASDAEHRQTVRKEAEKTADSVRRAGERTWHDVRPQLLSALRTVNAELEKMIDRMEPHEGDRSEGNASRPRENE